jgi:tRNA U34 5-methylaminomethyl-2-thiouridine-forming methyltransferase MnmC
LKNRIIITGDGSPTIYVEGMDETYHSVHGALTESVHVYINAGLKTLLQENIRVLEVGLGTGLNVWLTVLEETSLKRNIEYTALEPYPLDKDLIADLVGQEIFKDNRHLLYQVHSDQWDEFQPLSPSFLFKKINQPLETYRPLGSFDLIYMDAFAPSKQADIWSLDNIQKLYDMLFPGGILVSYCASGAFKRNLKISGFVIESLPGPPRKMEMTRARKIGSDV